MCRKARALESPAGQGHGCVERSVRLDALVLRWIVLCCVEVTGDVFVSSVLFLWFLSLFLYFVLVASVSVRLLLNCFVVHVCPLTDTFVLMRNLQCPTGCWLRRSGVAPGGVHDESEQAGGGGEDGGATSVVSFAAMFLFILLPIVAYIFEQVAELAGVGAAARGSSFLQDMNEARVGAVLAIEPFHKLSLR